MNRFRQNLRSQNLPRRGNYQLSPTIPYALHSWLTVPGSLTRHLQQQFRHFRVQVLAEGWGRPLRREAAILQIPPYQQVWMRIVLLYGNDQPRVYARTIIPPQSMAHLGYKIRHLANQSLGEFLFCHPRMQRSQFQLMQLTRQQQQDLLPAELANAKTGLHPERLWGRSSIFTLGQHPLLVSEYFLETLPLVQSRFFSHGH